MGKDWGFWELELEEEKEEEEEEEEEEGQLFVRQVLGRGGRKLSLASDSWWG